jgi:four helix bundle protein
MRNHRQLRVWHAACDLVVEVYRLSARLPKSERFELVTQLRRAAVSVPSNIGEGASRGTKPDFLRFLDIAAGSSAEVDTQVHLCGRLGFVSEDEVEHVEAMVQDVRRMLSGLMRTLRPQTRRD